MTKTTTKKQWVTAIEELSPEGHEPVGKNEFKTVAAARAAFEEQARLMGISWTVAEDGSVEFGEDAPPAPDEAEPTEEPAAEPEQAAQTIEETIPTMGERGRPRREDSLDTIELLTESNPKRPGSATHARFELYKTGMTVADFLAAGGRRVDLRWDADHQFIRLVAPAE